MTSSLGGERDRKQATGFKRVMTLESSERHRRRLKRFGPQANRRSLNRDDPAFTVVRVLVILPRALEQRVIQEPAGLADAVSMVGHKMEMRVPGIHLPLGMGDDGGVDSSNVLVRHVQDGLNTVEPTEEREPRGEGEEHLSAFKAMSRW